MILSKLQEALAEIPMHRQALAEIEEQLRSMISKLSGMPNVLESPMRAALSNHSQETATKDRIDEIVDILRVQGHPLHITRIAELLTQRRGQKIIRTSIEPGLNRHIARTKHPRVAKYKPSTYGLPEWKSKPALTQIAS